MYYTYMIRCSDNSIYTGITTDLERRLSEHRAKEEKGAKYTHLHTAVKIERAWISNDRVLASKLEYWIKKLKKDQKEDLIKNPRRLNKLLGTKIEPQKYVSVVKRVTQK